jgi:hypothetical protein
LRRVISVDGQMTPDLDSFAKVVGSKKTGDAVRLTTIDLKGRKRMLTMKADAEYWPLEELVRQNGQWLRRAVQPVVEPKNEGAE